MIFQALIIFAVLFSAGLVGVLLGDFGAWFLRRREDNKLCFNLKPSNFVLPDPTVLIQADSPEFIPQKSHPSDAGYDLCFSGEAMNLPPGQNALFYCGFRMKLPEGYEAQIRPRSGMAAKHRLTITNSPGTVDSNYTGKVYVCLHNLGNEFYTVSHGSRIAQMVIKEIPKVRLVSVDKLPKTDRGEGGFGSTGG